MAKQGKVLPARRLRGEESLLIRSAESLGRAIGKLQRQLDRASSADSRSGKPDGHAKQDGDGAAKTRRVPKRASKAAAKKKK